MSPKATPWLDNARQLVGLKEIVGSRHEAKVLQFFAEAGHPEVHNDETAWCAAFANAMLRRAGYAGTGSLAARSFLTWGTKLTKPEPGCIVVFKRGNSAWQGHVGFVTAVSDKQLKVLGGNQGNAVSVQTFPRGSSVLGYRWPQITSAPAAKPASTAQKATATAAVALVGVAGAAGSNAAVQQGISAWAILGWIAGLSILAGVIGLGIYRYIKGQWPWTGNQSQASSHLSPQKSELSSAQLSEAQLALQSAGLQATPSQKSSASNPRRKQSAKPSQKTRTRQLSSKPSKTRAVKKSAPKRSSRSKR